MNIINQHQDKTDGAFNQIKGPGKKIVFQEQFQDLRATNISIIMHYCLYYFLKYFLIEYEKYKAFHLTSCLLATSLIKTLKGAILLTNRNIVFFFLR